MIGYIQKHGVGKAADRVLRFLLFQCYHQTRNLKGRLLKKKHTKPLVRRIQGSKMWLDLTDQGLSTDLALDGIREPKSTQKVKNMLKKGDVVVDLGANLGYYALLESRIVGKKGKVYAIEPVPSNVSTLRKNIKLNGYKNLSVYQMAIGDKKTTTKMYISSLSNWNSFVNHKQKIIGHINVKVDSLDNFLKNKRSPLFVRMDVEGYEYQVLKGMKKLLSSKKPLKLFIELHPHLMTLKQTQYVLNTLKNNGFKPTVVVRCLTVTEFKVKRKHEYDYSHKSIDDLLKDKLFMSGKKGAFEMFFERR